MKVLIGGAEGELHGEDGLWIVRCDAAVPDGDYEAKIETETIRPFSFLFD